MMICVSKAKTLCRRGSVASFPNPNLPWYAVHVYHSMWYM